MADNVSTTQRRVDPDGVESPSSADLTPKRTVGGHAVREVPAAEAMQPGLRAHAAADVGLEQASLPRAAQASHKALAPGVAEAASSAAAAVEAPVVGGSHGAVPAGRGEAGGPAKNKSAAKTKTSRPKPGERRVQILQTLAAMLQEPGADRVTTAALARRLNVSEAALYRHFASKAQMFEGLIDFIERTLFSLINQITAQEHDALRQLRTVIGMLLAFAEKNPGMSRVLVGEALVNEDDRLQVRINEIVDRLETAIKQVIRNGVTAGKIAPNVDPGARATLIVSFVLGRWLRFAKTNFKHRPTEGIEPMVAALVA